VKYNEEKKVKKDDINVFIADISILKVQLNERNEEIAKIKIISTKQDEAIKKHQETIDKQY
jgi:hypothetical protein